MNKEEIIKVCPKCGGRIYHNKDVSKKTGKPYENWKCGSCDYIKWADTPKETPQPKKDAALMMLDELISIHKVLEEIRDKYDNKNI